MMRKIAYLSRIFILCVSAGLIFLACQNTPPYSSIDGKIFGTTYHIQADIALQNHKESIDSLLNIIDYELSTYKATSFISSVNQAKAGEIIDNWPSHFTVNITTAQEIYNITKGYYDVSVMPLVNYWGFGYTPKKPVNGIDSVSVDSLLLYVGMHKWELDLKSKRLSKKYDHQQLDMSSIAKGYAVDEVSRLLRTLGSSNHMVEIGGEVVALGVNPRGINWVIGINTPDADASLNEYLSTVSLKDRALASSGNYRNFYNVNGIKYGHTMNPLTGFPYQDELLSVTILAQDCMTADALATACMAMGFKRAKEIIDNMSSVDAIFMIGDTGGEIKQVFSNGFIQ